MNFSHKPFLSNAGAKGPNAPAFTQEWRCQDCGKLLGKGNGDQMQIRRKPAEYVVSFPVSAKCPGCSALNVKNKS